MITPVDQISVLKSYGLAEIISGLIYLIVPFNELAILDNMFLAHPKSPSLTCPFFKKTFLFLLMINNQTNFPFFYFKLFTQA
jgi:hypothetical protein